MNKEELPIWRPNLPPIYDIHRTYRENLEEGPFFTGTIPERIFPPEEEWINFLGYPVASPLGVAAGPLLNAQWVGFAAKMGFDILTYKTIRSREHAAHPVPNMVYLDIKGSLQEQQSILETPFPPATLQELAATNSFGMPSMGEDYLSQDIARANASLRPGQVMIVSVVGTHREEWDLFEDYVRATKIALEAGAQIIEANLSCPNVTTGQGSLYTDPEAVFSMTKKLAQTTGSIPLVIKLGYISDPILLKNICRAAAKGGAQALCGINTISAKVVKEDGSPALGPGRLQAGVCGAPILEASLRFIERIHAINSQERLGLTLMGTGGVVEPSHFDRFLEAGADIAMSALGMMWDPYLAAKYHQRKKMWNTQLEPVS